ncbi:MAG: bifunctional hydroxymethylpyrimidine kinase/phosphomethylpyrimidine kinase [Anaerolineales bacterium]|nr:bifunctional hydroxymethylpyrimidine kinase/phosphomethylpyrimidine kinase [Anaerolineales bacterium]
MEPAKVLTIGGSDSGGAAGVQADIKTITLLGGYAMSVLTAVTAQNSVTVAAVEFLAPEFVIRQLDVVLEDYGAAAIKTGFIGRADLIERLAERLAEWGGPLVVDPVLVNHRGESMFPPEVTAAYRAKLLPLATLVTPNRAEAAVLTGRSAHTLPELADQAQQLHELGARAVLLKAGRFGDEQVDLYFAGQTVQEMRAPHLETSNTHGSGDTLSAAIATGLGQGLTLPGAIERAQQLTRAALLAAREWKLGAGHGPLGHMSGVLYSGGMARSRGSRKS